MKWGKASNVYRSSLSDVFLGKDVKICSKLKGEHPCQAMRASSVFICSNDIFPLLIVFNGYFYSEKVVYLPYNIDLLAISCFVDSLI